MIFKVIIGVLVVTIIGLVTFKAIDPNLNGGNLSNNGGNDISIVEDSSISVGVSGEVVRPGNYVLESGATIQDLIDASGGVTSNADSRCYFFEATVEDNVSYYIAPLYEVDDVCGNNPIEKININNADATSLDELPGIGVVMSNSIVSYREENGEFMTLEAIMNVKGIGNSVYSKIKNNISLSD